MRTLVMALIALAVGGEVAWAKPKIAILGLELVVEGARADPEAVRAARQLTESLRKIPRSGAGKYAIAPNSNRELIDEKIAGNCETEKPSCMAPIGASLGADVL